MMSSGGAAGSFVGATVPLAVLSHTVSGTTGSSFFVLVLRCSCQCMTPLAIPIHELS